MGVIIGIAVGGFAILSTLLCLGLCRASSEWQRMEERAWREKMREKETGGR